MQHGTCCRTEAKAQAPHRCHKLARARCPLQHGRACSARAHGSRVAPPVRSLSRLNRHLRSLHAPGRFFVMESRPDGRPSSAPRAIPPRPPALSLPRASDDFAGEALPHSVEAIAFATSPLSAKVRAKWEARASDGGGGSGSFGAARLSSASPRAELESRLAAAQARRTQTIAWVMGRARRLRRAPPLEGQEAALAPPPSVAAVLAAASPRTPGPTAQMSPHEAWMSELSAEGAFSRRATRGKPSRLELTRCRAC